jgi:hypothetical protein
MTAETEFHGQCFCGQVKIHIKASELSPTSSYCHCPGCRLWASAPIAMNVYMKSPQAIDVYPFEGSVTRHTTRLETHVQNRFRCTDCGSHVANAPHGFDKDPHFGFPTSVFCDKETGKLPTGFPQPKAHTYYSTRIIDVADSLPKYPLFGSNSKAE